MSLFEAWWEKFAPEIEEELTLDEYANEARATAGAAISVIDGALQDLQYVAELWAAIAEDAEAESDRLIALAAKAHTQAEAAGYAVLSLRTVAGLDG